MQAESVAVAPHDNKDASSGGVTANSEAGELTTSDSTRIRADDYTVVSYRTGAEAGRRSYPHETVMARTAAG